MRQFVEWTEGPIQIFVVSDVQEWGWDTTEDADPFHASAQEFTDQFVEWTGKPMQMHV